MNDSFQESSLSRFFVGELTWNYGYLCAAMLIFSAIQRHFIYKGINQDTRIQGLTNFQYFWLMPNIKWTSNCFDDTSLFLSIRHCSDSDVYFVLFFILKQVCITSLGTQHLASNKEEVFRGPRTDYFTQIGTFCYFLLQLQAYTIYFCIFKVKIISQYNLSYTCVGLYDIFVT